MPEYGIGGPLPFLNGEERISKALADNLENGDTIVNVKYVYPSILTYLAKVTIKGQNSQTSNILVDLTKSQKIDISTPINDTIKKAVDSEKNLKSWERLEGKSSSTQAISGPLNTVIEKVISGVPQYLWYRGCSPTSAGMVLGYWSSHGYPNLHTGNTLIDQLANAMNTTSKGATNTSDIPSGIEAVARSAGYGLTIHSSNDSYGRDYSTWSDWKYQIDIGKPLLANMEGATKYSDHTVAGVGYG
ncbi:C39 family peptidase [Desulfosporosinus sp. PR]|uniref:C39 family peptidase n=1 Tax=Candidatus Desulfosporosinus nitrosoreducens TaxID=3401928 RepID=UPI0027E65B79|nr:C39 family peptidase [Desulfosporosinus sp. PR]MDQ7092434.1 C39 family peptidase [Desulfosporosinus sp. PR]